MKPRASILLAGILALGLGAGLTRAAARPLTTSPLRPQTYTVMVDFGAQGGEAVDFAPKWLDIYVGDTVTWRDADAYDPHTVSFGPLDMPEALNENNIMPLPQKQGPPIVALNPRVATATPGHTYEGAGFANSGLLRQGQTGA